jgi:4-hydroxy-2-oxoglutarate aldolase
MPASTGIDLDAETIAALSRHSNIKGVKDSGGNIVKLAQVKSMTDEGFSVIVGSGSMLLPALVAGASAGILALALIAPQQCLDIVHYFEKGKIEKARRLQADMIPVNIAVTSRWGVPALKEAMNMLGLEGGSVREPLLPASKEIKSELKKILKKARLKIK